ncbi:MAG: radical SAM protein [Candidatus Omnitrophica bacterium]|nr:radical SAM protein [Candidatus Omnitrophota bacterium]
MQKVVLINPPFSLEERYGSRIKEFGALAEPMGLAYIAGSLERENIPVEIIDAPALELSEESIAGYIRDNNFTAAGITFLTPMFDAVKKLSAAIKKHSPGIKIIAGGAHPTALPEDTLRECPDIDYLCIGEGEGAILDFLKFLRGEINIAGVPSLAYRDNGRIIKNSLLDNKDNLDSLPKPARHLLPMERYRLTASRTKKSGFCPTIILARGCPFDCRFCSHPFGRTFRRHSVKRVIEEIQELQEIYSTGQFNFEADTLTLDKQFIMELCGAIIKEGLDIRWTCESRTDTVDEQALKMMKDAGCWQISYGVESGSQRLLDIINKGIKKEDVERIFKITHRIGISIRGFFMLGLPSETLEESLETINFAKKLNPLWAQFTVTIPYPGTPMFYDLLACAELKHRIWAEYNTWGGWADKRLPYIPKGRTEEEIKNLQKKAMRMYYIRPNVIFNHARRVSSICDFNKIMAGGRALFKN